MKIIPYSRQSINQDDIDARTEVLRSDSLIFSLPLRWGTRKAEGMPKRTRTPVRIARLIRAKEVN